MACRLSCYNDTMIDDDMLGTGLAYKARLPFSWMLAEPVLSGVHEENEKNLRIILALSEYPPEHSEEFAALDFKINIVLELLADLVTHQRTLPPPAEVRLGADGLAWVSPDDNCPGVGDKITVSLYLNPGYPRPLVLQGTVENCADGRCQMIFSDQPDGVQVILEKYIFQQHRRQIAQARQGDS